MEIPPMGQEASVTIREFDQFMKRFDDLKEQIDKGFEGVHVRQDVTNGRIDKTEELVKGIQTNGCAQIGAHRALLLGPSDPSLATLPKWHHHPAAKAGSAGVGAGAGLGIVYGLVQIAKHLLGIR